MTHSYVKSSLLSRQRPQPVKNKNRTRRHLGALRRRFARLARCVTVIAGLTGAAGLAPSERALAQRITEPATPLVEMADPCDFASSGAVLFSYEQVLACYKRVPYRQSDLSNIIEVIEQHRSFSDLAEIYEERVQWRAALSALDDPSTDQDYESDSAMHRALQIEHKRFRNAHVVYSPPPCYSDVLIGFVPFEFGSTIDGQGRHRRQIIFIEGAPYLPELYAQATDLDVSRYVGMRVVSINGVDVLDYFRDYGENELRSSNDAGGELNAILTRAAYSLRTRYAGSLLPSRSSDVYVLEDRRGKRLVVRLPWMFVLADAFLGSFALPPTASTEEFVQLCFEWIMPTQPDAEGESMEQPWELGPLRRWREYEERLHRTRRAMRLKSIHRKAAADYFEVPPRWAGRGTEEIIPLTDNARVAQFGPNVTAIRLFNTSGWIDVARQGIEYACTHSDRLILDLRANNGGDDTTINWLYRYLFPGETDLTQAGKLPGRVRNDNAKLNELFFNGALFMQAAELQGADPCMLGVTPGCLLNPTTGEPIGSNELLWFAEPTEQEVRGGEMISLSREIGLPLVDDPIFDAASCAGRFADENLILLTNGTNASGGYFLPAAFKGRGIIVNAGGYWKEPMAMGRATGGATLSASSWENTVETIETLSEGEIQFQHQYAQFERQVDSQMEALGIYHKDRNALHLVTPIEEDLHLNVWTDSPDTDGYVFSRLLEKVNSAECNRP